MFLVYTDLDSGLNRLSKAIVKAQEKEFLCEYMGEGIVGCHKISCYGL